MEVKPYKGPSGDTIGAIIFFIIVVLIIGLTGSAPAVTPSSYGQQQGTYGQQ